MPIGDRFSEDWEDRVEWQLNQIRQSAMIVAAVVVLAVLLCFFAALAS